MKCNVDQDKAQVQDRHLEDIICLKLGVHLLVIVTSQDFIKFWGKFFAFILLVLIEFSQRFKTFESFNGKLF
jgi:hypothetical protein